MIFVDLETTGFKPGVDKIIEIGLVITGGSSPPKNWETLVNPLRKIPFEIMKLTGITQSMVDSAPTFEEIKAELYGLVQRQQLVAYNASFDKRFLVQDDFRFGSFLWFDYYNQIMRKYYKDDFENLKLKTVATALGIKLDQHHRALADAKALQTISKRFGFGPPPEA